MIDYTKYSGSTGPFTTDYFIWNAAIDKKIFRHGSLKLSLHDLLNNNLGVIRNKGSNYTEEVRTTSLQRFAVLSFIYRFNKVVGK